ncbi:hypothetical protein LR48_Vigan151s001300 [Vigna angularis]|uniref:Uncharacterized protein n=1 Tax=Phaseolus angularis TaxID=3914 RepID=A0A0L9T6D8_PHAAN|nr:hypothetical protein LR48_Vigan151s001300 [Vigna angularis]
MLFRRTTERCIVQLEPCFHHNCSIRDCLEARSFKKMKRLRLLQLDHVHLSRDYGYLLPMTEYDEYGTPLDRETFMKELENFY